MAHITDKTHQCAFQNSASANNTVLIASSLTKLAANSTTMTEEKKEEISKGASAQLIECAASAVTTARISIWQLRVHLVLWLQQLIIPKVTRKELVEAW